MKYAKMKATVKGHDYRGEEFEDALEFELIHPKDGEKYYGTGYYMTVDQKGDGIHNRYPVDVRYERTTDIEIIADRWISNFYGANAEDVRKEFDEKT